MCNGRTAESAAAELTRNLPSKIVRVLVRLKVADGKDRNAIEREARDLAETFKQSGAYIAEPIAGQPLVVAEFDKGRLVSVAKDPRIACITSDVPEGTN